MKKIYSLLITLTFSVASIAQTTLYSENFTGQDGVGYTYPGPSVGLDTVDWDIDLNGALPDFFRVTGQAFISEYTFGSPHWLSPSISISGYTNVSFSLNAFTSGNNANGNETFLVEYRLNGTGLWTQATTNGYRTGNFTTAITVSQTGLTGTSLELRVTTTSRSGRRHTFDNVLVTGISNCTTVPTNVTALTATPASQQVTLNWTNSSCFDEMLVVAKQGSAVTATPTGNGTAYTANASFGSGTQIVANEFVVYKGMGNSTITTALTNGTTYHFRVFTRKGTNWSSGVATSATPILSYCTPAANGGNFATSIRAVSFGSTPYTPTGERGNGGPGYQNYTAQSTTVVKGASSNLNVQIDTDGAYNVYTYVWIDWNQNGLFTDPGETYDLGNTFDANPGLTANSPLSVAIPSNAVLGTTRLRVLCQYFSSTAPVVIPTNGSCDGSTDGEVEDYTVNIIPPVTYVYDNGWSPSDPNGQSTILNDIIVANGPAVISSNISANSVTISSTASLTVDSGNTFTVLNDVDMDSNSVNYSSLIVNGTLNATVNYNRHVNGQTGVGVGTGANDLISAPVSGETFSAFATANPNIRSNPSNPTQKLFGPFSKASGTYDLWDTGAQGGNALAAGVGYRAASTDNGGFVFTGTSSNGIVTNSIVNSGPQFSEWNLIGNPYPSYINVREFLEYDVDPSGTTVRNIDLMTTNNAAIYGYDGDATGTGGDGWVVYNLATAIDVNMAPGQGFFVTANAANVAAYDMTFTPSMRRIDNSDDFVPGRMMDENNAHLKLQAAIGTSVHNTDIYFNDNATSGLDFGYDAGVYGNNAPAKAIYSQLVQDNTGVDMAIQSLAYVDLGSEISVPLGINAAQGQQVTVSISESDLPFNIQVYLEDNVAGTFTLLNTTDYIFTATSTLNDTGRFFLRFTNNTLSTQIEELNGLQIYTSKSPKALFVKGLLTSETNVSLFDIQGRLVLSSTLDASSNSNKIDVSQLNDGVYLVKLTNSAKQKTQKVIIR